MTGDCLFRADLFLLIFLFETQTSVKTLFQLHIHPNIHDEIMDECEVLNFYCNTLPSSDVSMNISRILMQDFYCSKYSEYYRQADPNNSNNLKIHETNIKAVFHPHSVFEHTDPGSDSCF